MPQLKEDALVEWAEEKQAAIEALIESRRKIDALGEKMRAYLVLFGETLDAPTVSWAKAMAAATNLTEINNAKVAAEKAAPALIEAIVKVVTAATAPVTPGDIRERLPSVGYREPVTSSSGYFYTAVKRLHERGVIRRLEDGRYAVVGDEEEEEENDAAAA